MTKQTSLRVYSPSEQAKAKRVYRCPLCGITWDTHLETVVCQCIGR